ncbi:MAG: hypothetical protein KAV99_00940 [Candidatus Latescibacteria bacterium]|nr:hypothetical protein [Candidatus Latescibacterota bacterium]
MAGARTGVWHACDRSEHPFGDVHKAIQTGRNREIMKVKTAIKILYLSLVFLVSVSERLDAVSILGEVVEASDYIFTGCYIGGREYGSTLIEAKIKVIEWLKGSIQPDEISVKIPWGPEGEDLPAQDWIGRDSFQRKPLAKFIVFVKKGPEGFELAKPNWSVYTIENGWVLGLHDLDWAFLDEIRSRVRGEILWDQPGRIMKAFAASTNQILAGYSPFVISMMHPEWPAGVTYAVLRNYEVVWNSEPEYVIPREEVFLIQRENCTLPVAPICYVQTGVDRYLYLGQYIPVLLDYYSPFGITLKHCFWFPLEAFSIFLIKDGKVYPFDFSVQEFTDEIIRLKQGSPTGVSVTTWGAVKRRFSNKGGLKWQR